MKKLLLSLSVLGLLLWVVPHLMVDEKNPPQAAPMKVMLKAAQDLDVASFQSAFSQQIRNEETKNNTDWKALVKGVHDKLREQYGDYKMAEFTYSFKGSASAGNLTVSHKGQTAYTVELINEEGQWRLNEH